MSNPTLGELAQQIDHDSEGFHSYFSMETLRKIESRLSDEINDRCSQISAIQKELMARRERERT